MKKLMKNVPNCAICKWAYIGITQVLCNAQCGKSNDAAYNTKECRLLFEVKEKED